MTSPIRPPLQAPPVHTMGIGHLPLAVVVTALIASLFAAAFKLGYVLPLASVSLLVLIAGFAAIDPRARCSRNAAAGPSDLATMGTRFTIARLALACLLAGVAATRVDVAPDLMLWSLAAIGLVAALLDASDGWLARITGSASDYGTRLSGLVACVLTLALALLAWQLDQAGVWVILAGVPGFLVGPLAAAPAGDGVPPWRPWAALALNALLAAALVPAVPDWSAVAAAVAAVGLAVLLAADTLRRRHRQARIQNERISRA